MALQTHIKQLCKDLEVDELPTEDEGVFLLPTAEDEYIRMTDTDPGVYFDAHVAPCPRERREELLTLLMMSDLFGAGTSHAVIGLDAKGENCTLSYALREASDYREFFEALEEFLNQVDFWREEIGTYGNDAGT